MSISANGHFPQIHEISFHFRCFGSTRRLCNLLSLTSTRLLDPMSALKRTLASPAGSPRLTSHVSHHNAAVTLFQLSSNEDDIEHSPRRSKRVKTQNNTGTEGHLGLDNLSHNVLSVKSWKTGADATASGSVLPSASPPRDVQTSPKKFKAIPQSLTTPHPPPSNWRETYDVIKDMRSRFVAPVDTMGCDMAQHKETDPKVNFLFF